MTTVQALVAAAAAAIGLLILIAVLQSDPSVTVEPLSVDVPTTPEADETIAVDAALYLPEETPAPAIILAHGFGSSRAALDGPARSYAEDGYVVLAYSARGFGRSGGVIGLNDPRREVADVTALVDVLAARDEVVQDGVDDPRVGIGGGSYGGGLSLLADTQEPRLDAVVAAAAWHSLSRSLAPDGTGGGPGVLKEQWASVLFTSAAVGSFAGADGAGTTDDPAGAGGAQSGPAPDQIDLDALLAEAGIQPEALDGLDLADLDPAEFDLAEIDLSLFAQLTPDEVDLSDQPELAALNQVACGRFSLEICVLYAQAATVGRLSSDAVDILDRASLSGRLDTVTAPTMLISGLDDTLFDLRESADNAAGLQQADVPLAVRWISGGHGEASSVTAGAARRWFDTHLRGGEAGQPVLRWTDAASGTPQTSETLPDARDQAEQRIFTLAPDGGLEPGRLDPDTNSVERPLVHPPGGVPAALSTLPGLGSVGGLLPGVDIPGQNATFTTAPLTEDLTVLGSPRIRVGVTSVQPQAAIFVKLYDVTPGGQTTLIHSAVNPQRLDGPEQTVAVELTPVAYRIVAGNRLRVTVATTDQGFATGREPGLVLLAAGPDATLGLPAVPTEVTSGLPTIVRIAIPVLLIVLLALIGRLLTARHEQRLRDRTATAGTSDGVPPITIRGLVKEFDDGKVAVDGLDLTVERGQVFGLLGPNGAGKTTTMRMLLGLSSPTAGDIQILGQDVSPGHPVLGRVGVLVEGPGFAPYLTGMQNLVSFWRAGGRPLEEANLDRALAVADLGAAIHKPTRTYSHGMRQRLAIAQALLGDPEILVLDEPTDGLDPEQIKAMRRLLAELGEEGLTVLVSSHLLSEVEQMCTHAAVVREGSVVAAGPVSELVGTNSTLVVTARDLTRAQEVLAGLLGEDAVAREGEGLVVSLNGSTSSEVISHLVTEGVEVSSAAPRGRLEDAFLELTRDPA